MPCWKMHLWIVERLKDKISYSNWNDFVIANLAPDMLSGYVVPCKDRVESVKSHYIREKLNVNCAAGFAYFKQCFGNLDSDLKKGYFVHLLVDYFWNTLYNTRFYTFDTTVEKPYPIKQLILHDGTILQGDSDDLLHMKHTELYNFASFLRLTCYDYTVSDKFKAECAKIFNIGEEEIKASIEYVKAMETMETTLTEFVIMLKKDYESCMEECFKFVIREIVKAGIDKKV